MRGRTEDWLPLRGKWLRRFIWAVVVGCAVLNFPLAQLATSKGCRTLTLWRVFSWSQGK